MSYGNNNLKTTYNFDPVLVIFWCLKNTEFFQQKRSCSKVWLLSVMEILVSKLILVTRINLKKMTTFFKCDHIPRLHVSFTIIKNHQDFLTHQLMTVIWTRSLIMMAKPKQKLTRDLKQPVNKRILVLTRKKPAFVNRGVSICGPR